MLEKMYAKNLMDSLYDLFIFIRSFPTDPVLYDLLQQYRFWLNKNPKINYRSIRQLIKELNKIENHSGKVSVISELTKVRLFKRAPNMERIYQSLGPIKYILESLSSVMEHGEEEKTRIMASSVHNYPSFILGNYHCTSHQFWREHIGYYNSVFQSDFMEDWKYLFFEFYPKSDR